MVHEVFYKQPYVVTIEMESYKDTDASPTFYKNYFDDDLKSQIIKDKNE